MVEAFNDYELKKQGWLQKQSAGRRWWKPKNWKKRFFQAKVKGQQKVLAYYTVSKRSKYSLKGSVDLTFVSEIRRSGTSIKPQFELVCPRRTWVFECLDANSREDWIEQLERIVWGIRDERLPSTNTVVESRVTSISDLFKDDESSVSIYGDETADISAEVIREQFSPVVKPEKKPSLDDMWKQTLTLMEGSEGFLDVYASKEQPASPRFSLGS